MGSRCSHAIFLINRMPCQNLQMVSPFVKLFGQSPSLTTLKVFGTAIYPYLRPYSDNKLQAKSDECVFLGYSLGYKGVLCYNRNTKRLLMSRHVIHDESVYPFQSVCPPNMSYSLIHASSQKLSSMIVPVVLPRSSNVSKKQFQDTNESSQTMQAISPSDSSSQESTQATPQVTTLYPTSSHLLPVHASSRTQVPHSFTESLLLHDISVEQSIDVETSNPLEVGHDILPPVIPSTSTHGMITRLKSGAIQRKDYATYHVPVTNEDLCLTSHHDDIMFSGFTDVLDIHDFSEHVNYKQAVMSECWRNAMTEEFNALQKQGT